MRHDVLADCLSSLQNVKDKGLREATVKPISKTVKAVLEVLQKEGYVEAFEIIQNKRGDLAKIKLTNQINSIGPIKPRFSAKIEEFEKFEKRFLPAKDFGRLIISNSKGIMTHLEAKAANEGGVLLAYVY